MKGPWPHAGATTALIMSGQTGNNAMCRLLSVLFLACAVSALAAAELRTLSGKKVEGDLVAITDKELVLAKDGKRTTVPFADILQVDLQKAGEAAAGGVLIDVELTDGSLLHCKKMAFKGKEAQLTLS